MTKRVDEALANEQPQEASKSKRTRNFVIAKGVPEEMLNRVKAFPSSAPSAAAIRTGLKADMVMKCSYPFGRMARLSIGRVGQTETDPEDTRPLRT